MTPRTYLGAFTILAVLALALAVFWMAEEPGQTSAGQQQAPVSAGTETKMDAQRGPSKTSVANASNAALEAASPKKTGAAAAFVKPDVAKRVEALRAERDELKRTLTDLKKNGPRKGLAATTPAATAALTPDAKAIDAHVQARIKERQERPKTEEEKTIDRVQWTKRERTENFDMAEQLGLSADVVEEIHAIQAEKMLNIGERNGETAEDRHKRWAQHRDEIKELLGEEGFKKWEAYENVRGNRNDVVALREACTKAGFPMDHHQAVNLLSIVNAESAALPYPKAQDHASFSNRSDELDRRVLERAHTVLTPDQLLAAKEAMQQRAEVRQLYGRSKTKL